MHRKHKLFIYFNFFRIVIGIAIINLSKMRYIVNHDVEKWALHERLCGSFFEKIGYLLLFKPEFNSLICVRIGRFWKSLFKVFFKTQVALFIATPSERIGGGLYIQHGFSTIIAAQSIGENCFINQQVTIGYEGNRRPVIGNNVRICAGAKIIGGVKIGNNVIVGANGVVVKDIPDNEVWGGVPAKRIKGIEKNG